MSSFAFLERVDARTVRAITRIRCGKTSGGGPSAPPSPPETFLWRATFAGRARSRARESKREKKARDRSSSRIIHPRFRRLHVTAANPKLAIARGRSSISPRKQLWIKAVKKLTSERLGREGLAAWEDRKCSNDPDPVDEVMDTSDAADDSSEAEPEAAVAEEPVEDEEAQSQPGR